MLLDVYKDGELVETIELSASKRIYKVGRQAGMADIVLTHGSISREHATLTVSASGSVVVADLGSAHGTLISGKRLNANKPHLLPPSRSLTFGQSTRVFKLRDGGTGFVGEADIPLHSITKSAAIDDPRVQAVLTVLREGGRDCERHRPDGYLRVNALLGTLPLQQAGWTEVELASLAAKVPEAVEATSEDGELLLRALEGHLDSARVDTTLRIVPFPPAMLPEHLVFCSAFKDWNAVRSHGAGAGSGPPQPIRLSVAAPGASAKLPSLGGRAANLHVYVRAASLLGEGCRLYQVLDDEADASARLMRAPQEENAGAVEAGGVGAMPTPGVCGPAMPQGPTMTGSPMMSTTLGPQLPPTLPTPMETIICVGDPASGLIGPWHFERVLSARDGSEMMSVDEIEPLRQQRRAAAADAAAKAAAAEAAAQAKQMEREAKRRRLEEASDTEARQPARHNPYLAHMQDD